MTDDAPLTPRQEDDALAAELAIGLLSGAEADAAVARLSSDPDFAKLVRDWQERLAGLAERLTPVMAPARARHGIRERLGHASAPLSVDPSVRSPWWRAPWALVLGAVATAAVVAMLVLPAIRTPDVTQPGVPGYQAQLVSDDQALQVAATVAGREMQIALEAGAAAAGRDWEIWWIEPDGTAPISIGIVPRDGALRMTLPEGLDPSDQIRIALSDEPEGGSPTGQATGPVVAVAELTRL